MACYSAIAERTWAQTQISEWECGRLDCPLQLPVLCFLNHPGNVFPLPLPLRLSLCVLPIHVLPVNVNRHWLPPCNLEGLIIAALLCKFRGYLR